MKILLLGDSFALPRVKIEEAKIVGIETEYENTYPELLRKKLKEYLEGEDILIIDKYNHANTTQNIINCQMLEVYTYKPECLII